MLTEWQKKKVHEIAVHYGQKSQEQMAIEECAELIQAITKSNRIKMDEPGYLAGKVQIAEEIADVLIMCEQLMYLHCIGDVVKEQVDFKVARQLARMEKGE